MSQVLLLHMDDTDLSDSSPSGHTVTKNGDACRSDAQSKFGGYSAYFDGTGDYLSLATSDDWDWGTDEWTVDCWFRVSNTSAHGIFSLRGPSAAHLSLYTYLNNIRAYVNSNAIYTSISVDTWYHVALVRSGDTVTMYLNGNEVDSVDVTGASFNDNDSGIFVGSHGSVFAGYIDEFRILKGEAAWTDEFTPETEAYETEAIEGTVTGEAGIADTMTGNSEMPVSMPADEAGIGDSMEAETPHRAFADTVGMDDIIHGSTPQVALVEDTGLDDELSGGGSTYTVSVPADAAGIADTITGNSEMPVSVPADEAGIGDEVAAKRCFVISCEDGFSMEGMSRVSMLLFLYDTWSIWGGLTWGWRKTAKESISVEDLSEIRAGILISEWLLLSELQAIQWAGVEQVEVDLILTEYPRAAQIYAKLAEDGFSIADAVQALTAALLLESLILSGNLTDIGLFHHEAAETVSLIDSPAFSWLKELADSFSIADTQTLAYALLNTAADGIGFAGSVTLSHVIATLLAEEISMAEGLTMAQALQQVVADGIGFTIDINLAGELWQCWVLNTAAYFPSVYSGYDFNSYAVFENTVYGLKDDGLYEITGSTDNGSTIHNGIVLPDTDFGMQKKKRIRTAYFGITGTGAAIKMVTDNGTKTYTITGCKAVMSRTAKGRRWTITVAEFETLDFVSLVPVVMVR